MTVVRKMRSVQAALDCVSPPSAIVEIEEEDLRDLLGDSETALVAEETVEDASALGAAFCDALEKLSEAGGDLSRGVALAIFGDDLKLKDISFAIDEACSVLGDKVFIIWSHGAATGLKSGIKIMALVPEHVEVQ
jgi:hypothetical protein